MQQDRINEMESSDERPGISEIIPHTENVSCTDNRLDYEAHQLGMPLSVDLSPRTDSKENLTIENIISTLSFWLHSLPKVENSIPQCSSSNNRTGNNSGSSDFYNSNSHTLDNDYLFVHGQIDKLRVGLNQIKEAFHKLYFEGVASELFQNLFSGLDDISNIITQASTDLFPTDQVQSKLSALKNNVLKLKFKFQYLPSKMSFTNSDSLMRNVFDSVPNELPMLDGSHKFLRTSVFTGFQEAFEALDIKLKLCLLSFAVLPENAVLKRRLLIHWWVGECLVDPLDMGEETAEDIADEILKELTMKGFIESVEERRKLVTDGFKMQPLMHCMVIVLAQEAGFFDSHFDGIPVINSLWCNRACLVKDEDRTLEQVLRNSPSLDQEKLQTIFNVNDPLPDLRFERIAKMKNANIVEWFSRMKNVNVLYLGRWQSSGEHHIEVQSTEFLKGLKYMKRLRLLSLQGISGINELPDSMRKLTNLSILDLKACHNLEALPDAIASLKNLLHLDISECYLLDGMPKGLASLSELQVLKGFVIDNLNSRSSCTLKDLIELKKLSKLSINTSCEDFPTRKELWALKKFEALQKLAIAWNYSGAAKPTRASRQQTRTSWCFHKKSDSPLEETWEDHDLQELPTELKKLELQSFPHTGMPAWLIPGKLQSLKKLYIRGGKLNNLRQTQEGNDKWKVEILRMKYLKEFNMDWKELQTSFPELKLLENVKCPNFTSHPCCDLGVWLKKLTSDSETL